MEAREHAQVPADPVQPGWLADQLRYPVHGWLCRKCGWENRGLQGRHNLVCGGAKGAQRAGKKSMCGCGDPRPVVWGVAHPRHAAWRRELDSAADASAVQRQRQRIEHICSCVLP